MQISQHFSQRMEQKLVMTRQMIQSIEMLQLPLMDLEQNINQELNNNPWLERMEGEVTAEAEESGTRPAVPEEKPQNPNETEARIKRLESLMNEWNDPNTRSSSGMVRRAGEDDAKMEAMQNTAAPSESLEDFLLQQLHLAKEDPRLKMLAEAIIGSLDDSGYLKVPLMDLFYKSENGIRQELVESGCTEEEAELALELVQSLEPPGVGARNVQESLILQLRRMPGTTEFEEQLIERHLDDLSHNRLPKIAKDMGVTVERVKEAHEFIRHLNPKPGRGFGGGRPQYVVPDVQVEEIDGQNVIRINEHFLPTLRISGDSLQLLKKEAKDVAVRDYIMSKLGSAVWLMESVIQRRQTLYRITEQIVSIQKDFFEHGPSHLRPLMMQEVAERIGMHVSTVSRALAGKYIQTPQGLFPMKYFFTGGFSTADGESESNRAIMLKISEMVKAEDKNNPLSDQEIVARLQSEGIVIARRTVAKYREKLNIPSSRQRKAY
ncbi:MAG TPA: RNA polymerase factor sigma-54 [Planctomycetota bacterium]|jgi:RNA polymerase sigma-54 factor